MAFKERLFGLLDMITALKFSAFLGQNGRFGIIGIFLLAEFLRYN